MYLYIQCPTNVIQATHVNSMNGQSLRRLIALLLLSTIRGTSPVFNTRIKIYDAQYTFNSGKGDGKINNYTHPPNPLYLYENGMEVDFGTQNYYLAQTNVTDPPAEKLIDGTHSVAPHGHPH